MLEVSIFSDWELNEAADTLVIEEVVRSVDLPRDYLEFMRLHNGGEGFLGANYLILWKLDDLLQHNKGYEIEKYMPGFFVFGSSGGGEAFAFDMRSARGGVVGFEFIGMNPGDTRELADTFTQFIQKYATSDDD